MKKLIGQVIALTKNILLNEPEDKKLGMEQFSAGRTDPFSFGGFGIEWWYTEAAYKLVENISFMIITEYPSFSDCDHKSIQTSVRSTLREICVDKHVFNSDDVCFGRKKTLFECRSVSNTEYFAKYLLEKIIKNVKSSITDWCVIYTAPRISGDTFFIESERIHVIHKSDKSYWSRLSDIGYVTNDINPETGNYKDRETTQFSRLSYEYLFITESRGTLSGSRFSSSLKLRKLFSVIYAVSTKNRLHKVMARAYSHSMQIPHKDSNINMFTTSEIGKLLPYYLEEKVLNAEDINKIKAWYELEARLPKGQRDRINKCAHFINKGMNSKDIESYIQYFVALDALYGNRGSVEKSIVNGVSELPQNNGWKEKITWLFDLRNELVHGGSRFIEEWPDYMRYYKHFNSEPALDIEQLAFLALSSMPSILTESNKLLNKEK
ncbi:HEPN domain-containing protein [Psychrobacter sp. BI730]|uniref:HEPN domain-containing protein n=1 Tax=Psychrobacter sp. BI730 TaxID=2705463 RepID=UPI0015C6F96A|nr:HEPN domain-containing protein [Psychrobacter sp. BI730]NYR10386.1 hypothetical protein [Psychrobacter sp. BI730]